MFERQCLDGTGCIKGREFGSFENVKELELDAGGVDVIDIANSLVHHLFCFAGQSEDDVDKKWDVAGPQFIGAGREDGERVAAANELCAALMYGLKSEFDPQKLIGVAGFEFAEKFHYGQIHAVGSCCDGDAGEHGIGECCGKECAQVLDGGIGVGVGLKVGDEVSVGDGVVVEP